MDDKYRKIEEINLIDIYLEFDKEKLTNIFEGFNFKKLLEDIKDMIIPVTITIDYVTTAILELELGGKRLKGKVTESTIRRLKNSIKSLKEDLNDDDVEDKEKIQEEIKSLEGKLEEAESEKESEEDLQEARTQSEGTKEEEAVEGFEEEPKKVSPTSEKRVIPQLDKYFRKIKSRINRLDRVILSIKNQQPIEV